MAAAVAGAGLAGPAAAATTPLVETAAMQDSGDVADGVCVWVHPADRSRSVVLGANKSEGSSAAYGGLYAFDLSGARYGGGSWQAGSNWFADGLKINSADVAYGFAEGAGGYDLHNGTLRLLAREGVAPRIEQAGGAGVVNVISAAMDAPGLNVSVADGELRLGAVADANRLDVAGTLALTGGASDCRQLVLGPDGVLDVADSLLVREGSLAELMAAAIAGRNGGTWDGASGILSAAAAGDPDLAVALAETPDGVLIQVALLGDADLDGTVDHRDYLLVKDHLGAPADGWAAGDFDYDGDTDGLDLLALEGNFGKTHPAPPAVPVPEPGTVMLLLVSAGWLLPRRPAG